MSVAALLALLGATIGPKIGDGTVERACVPTGRAAYGVFDYLGDRRCLDFEPAREMIGVWVNDFEGSSWHEGARTMADVDIHGDGVWLEIDEKTILPRHYRKQYYHAYRMTFVGRLAKPRPRPGQPLGMQGFGHMGASPGLVLVDRIIRSEDLGRMTYR